MTSGTLFTIVIPTFNRADIISDAIQSVLVQTYPDFELIIIDDGSTDNTEEVVRAISDKRLRYYKVKNSERAAARNIGIQKAEGSYVSFLDSDDKLYPSYLNNALETLKHYKFPPFMHLAYEVKDEAGKVLSKKNYINSDSYKFLVYGNPLSCLGIFVKREILLRFQFNEDYSLSMAEDWELWLRLMANFGIKTDNRISAAMIYHERRSVAKSEGDKIAVAKELAIKYAFEDKMVNVLFGQYKRQIKAFAKSYVSLHYVLSGYKKKGLQYLIKGFVLYPGILFTRRFLVIIKYLIVG